MLGSTVKFRYSTRNSETPAFDGPLQPKNPAYLTEASISEIIIGCQKSENVAKTKDYTNLS